MRERVQDIRWGVGGMFQICDEPGLPNEGARPLGDMMNRNRHIGGRVEEML